MVKTAIDNWDDDDIKFIKGISLTKWMKEKKIMQSLFQSKYFHIFFANHENKYASDLDRILIYFNRVGKYFYF